MTTPVYLQFPHRNIALSGETGKTITVSTASGGILHAVVLAKALSGTVTIADAVGTIALFAASTPAQTFLFDTDYSQPLTCATTASD